MFLHILEHSVFDWGWKIVEKIVGPKSFLTELNKHQIREKMSDLLEAFHL